MLWFVGSYLINISRIVPSYDSVLWRSSKCTQLAFICFHMYFATAAAKISNKFRIPLNENTQTVYVHKKIYSFFSINIFFFFFVYHGIVCWRMYVQLFTVFSLVLWLLLLSLTSSSYRFFIQNSVLFFGSQKLVKCSR